MRDWRWMLYLMLQLAIMAGCNTDRGKENFGFYLKDSVVIDESRHPITRKVHSLRMLNDSVIAIGVNDMSVVCYSRNTGKEIFAFDGDSVDLPPIYDKLKRHFEGTLSPSDRISVLNYDSMVWFPVDFPKIQLNAPIWVTGQGEIAVLAQILMPYHMDSDTSKNEMIVGARHFSIFLIDPRSGLKKVYLLENPVWMKDASYSQWYHHGFILQGNSLYINMISKDMPRRYENNMVAKFIYKDKDSIFDMVKPIGVPYNLLKAKSKRDTRTNMDGFRVFANNYIHFEKFGDSLFVSNGTGIFSLIDGREIFSSFVDTAQDVNEKIVSYGWLKSDPDKFIVCSAHLPISHSFYQPDGVVRSDPGTEISFYLYSFKQKRVIRRMTLPGKDAFPYFNGEEILLVKRCGEQYKLFEYEVVVSE